MDNIAPPAVCILFGILQHNFGPRMVNVFKISKLLFSEQKSQKQINFKWHIKGFETHGYHRWDIFCKMNLKDEKLIDWLFAIKMLFFEINKDSRKIMSGNAD